jgi:methionyl-tRNA formyltransferase
MLRSIRQYHALFFGSDEFAAISLQKMIQHSTLFEEGIDVVVPPMRDFKKRGQMFPVAQVAKEAGLCVYEAPVKTLKGWQPPGKDYDFGVVVSFGYFIPRSLLQQFKIGSVNVHPSLLPQYRGAAPIQHSILNKEKETGVSIIELDPSRFDAGRILKQTRGIPVLEKNYTQLYHELAHVGANDLISVLSDFEQAKQQAIVQDEQHVTLAPKLHSDMGHIDPLTLTASDILTKHRGLSPKIPLFILFRGNRLKLLDIQLWTTDKNPKQWIQLQCKNNEYLAIGRLQMDKKKEVSAAEFRNGYGITCL